VATTQESHLAGGGMDEDVLGVRRERKSPSPRQAVVATAFIDFCWMVH